MSGIFKEIRQYHLVGDYQYGGTYDLEVTLNNGKVYIIDIKTGKPVDLNKYPRGYENWRWQTAAYRHTQPDAEGNAVIHISTENEQFHFFDLSDTFDIDLDFFLHLVDAWYAHPEKYPQLKDNHGPSVTEICGLLGFAPAGWTAVNAMREKMYELADASYANFPDLEETDLLFSKESLVEMTEEARKWGGRGKSRYSMNIGKKIHECIETFLRHGIEPSNTEQDVILQGYLNFREWFDENVKEVLGVEVICYG